MLVLRTFGGLSLANGGKPLTGAAGQRGRLAILAVIAASGETGVSRDRLHAIFWPESDSEHARGALKQALYALRRDLKEDELILGTSELRLNLEVCASDIQEFEGAVRVGDLESAVARYAGPFLDGIHLRDVPEFERWAETERDRLLHQFRDALEQLARAAEQQRDRMGAVAWRRKRAASEPLSARVACEYMTALANAGDREAAGRHARVYTELVAAELGADPDASVVALAESIRTRRDPHVDVLPSGSATPSVHLAPPSADVAAAAAIPDDVAFPRGSSRRRLRFATFAVTLISLAAAFAVLLWPAAPLTVGTTTQVTTTPGLEVDPAMSPDGQLAAYAAGPIGAMRVFVKQLAGGRILALTADSTGDQRSPTWSPDGSRIAFRSRGGIYVVPSLGGVATRMFGDDGRVVSGPRWSRDGKWIAYADDRGIWLRGVDSGPPRQLVSGVFQSHSPAWSPDGSRIAFVVGNLPYVNGNVGPSSVWITPVSGGVPTRISDSVHLNTAPVFAADGRSVLYVSNRDGTRDVFQQPLRNGVQPTTAPSRLTTGSNVFAIDLPGDGSRLVYSVLTARSNIWAAAIAASGVSSVTTATQLTSEHPNVEVISVSTDGKWLIFDSNKFGNADIYKMRVGGGDAIRLTSNTADDFAGVLSPDDSAIVYYSFRTGSRHLRVMSADGTNDHAITPFARHEWSPQWSPDGRRVSFVSIESGRHEVYIVSRTPAGTWSAPSRITNSAGGSSAAAWSPDGRFISTTRDSGLVLIDVQTNEARVVVDGRTARHVPDYTAWGRDPSMVYYRAVDANGQIGFWRVPVSGGSPQLVLPMNDPARTTRRPEFATDGQRIYFTIANDEADVWIATLRR